MAELCVTQAFNYCNKYINLSKNLPVLYKTPYVNERKEITTFHQGKILIFYHKKSWCRRDLSFDQTGVDHLVN